jgi:hypothetical protein
LELDEALYTYLKSYSGLANVSQRIYPEQLPQKPKYPAITFQEISESEVETLSTPAGNLIATTYQFDCWDSTKVGVNTIAKNLRKAFKNYSGLTGGANGVQISAIVKLNRLSDTERDANGVVIVRRVMLEFQIWHYETA